MLRDDVQDKLVETLDLLQKSIRMVSEPTWGEMVSSRVIEDFKKHGTMDCKINDKGIVERTVTPTTAESAPSPARRMWKRWGHIGKDVGFYHVVDAGVAFTILPNPDENYREPVTILPGHDAIERIEREAYERGREYGFACGVSSANDTEGAPVTIDGVSPVVVDGFTWDSDTPNVRRPWCYINKESGDVVCAWMDAGEDCNTPCRVHLYPGIGPDGKRAGGRE